MSKILAALALLISLGACGSPIVLQDPKTNQMAQCDTDDGFWGAMGQSVANGDCAEGYERAGWTRMN